MRSLTPASSSYVTSHRDRSWKRISRAPPLPARESATSERKKVPLAALSEGLLGEGLIPDGSFQFKTLFLTTHRHVDEAKLASPPS